MLVQSDPNQIDISMKPKILLYYGYGWAASSPLVYTLQRNIKYAHFGYTKTFRYWELIDVYKKVCNNTWENWSSYEPSTHRMNLKIDLEPLYDFSLDHYHKIMIGEPTISKYIEFYHALYDHVITKGYKSVGDAYSIKCKSNRYFSKASEAMKQFSEAVKSEFDVKVIGIVRDPVRRAWGNYLATVEKYESMIGYSPNLILPARMRVYDYVKDFNRMTELFGDNVYVTVMEELWEGDGATGLSEFLEHPIKKSDLWKNLYSPDKGHLVEYDKDVPCQAYGQDMLELTPETYLHYRKKYDYIYQSWKQKFGSLPLHWGQPISYRG